MPACGQRVETLQRQSSCNCESCCDTVLGHKDALRLLEAITEDAGGLQNGNVAVLGAAQGCSKIANFQSNDEAIRTATDVDRLLAALPTGNR